MCQALLVLIIEAADSIQCAYHLVVISSLRACLIPSWVESCLSHKSKGSLRTGIQVVCLLHGPQNRMAPCYKLVN